MYFGIWNIEWYMWDSEKNWDTDCKNLSFEETVDKLNHHL